MIRPGFSLIAGRTAMFRSFCSDSSRNFCSRASSYDGFQCLAVSHPRPFVLHVQLNRPDRLNALNTQMWREVGECFRRASLDSDCRAVVLSGAGRLFCSGLDFGEMGELASIVSGQEEDGSSDVARRAARLDPHIKQFQDWITDLEKCRKPVLAAIHGACIGGAVDLVTAADVRYCSQDAYFQVKEVDIGLAADVGTLQRLPRVIGSQSLVRELCFTARPLPSSEALNCGLVSRVLPDRETTLDAVVRLASLIASKSPVAVQTTKQSLIFSRDHSVQQGLDHVRTLNSTMLQSSDLQKAAMAAIDKSAPPPQFSKL